MEREGGKNHDKFAVSLFMNATVVAMFLEEFGGCLDTFRHGGTITCEVTSQKKCGKTRDTLMKLLPSTSSAILLVLHTLLDTFCLTHSA